MGHLQERRLLRRRRRADERIYLLKAISIASNFEVELPRTFVTDKHSICRRRRTAKRRRNEMIPRDPSKGARNRSFLLLLLLSTVPGCGSSDESVAWTWYDRASGGRLLYYFPEPKLVIRFDTIEASDSGAGRHQITVAGNGTSSGYSSSRRGTRTSQYENGVATIKPNDYHLRITDHGQKIWSGDELIAELPGEDWTVIALDKDGKSRELKPGEQTEIIHDATTGGLFREEWKSIRE
jgi:hypothetical protein